MNYNYPHGIWARMCILGFFDHGSIPMTFYYICSAQSRNRDNSRIVLDKVRILTLLGEVGIPTWHGSIPELSLRKVGIGTK